MPTIPQIFRDPEFNSLPEIEQKRVIREIDPDFSQLNQGEQHKAYVGLKKRFGLPDFEMVSSHSPTKLAPAHKTTTIEPEDPGMRKKRFASEMYTPFMEGLGAGVGAVVGSGAAPLAGTVAGGALGYGIARRGARLIDEWIGLKEAQSAPEMAMQTAQDVATGATFEMGGQLAGQFVFMPAIKGGRWIFKKIGPKAKDFMEDLKPYFGLKPSENYTPNLKGYEQKAAEILVAHTPAGPIYSKNAAEARRIEDATGIKFSLAQQTGAASTIKLERARVRGPFGADELLEEQMMHNNEMLDRYYNQNFGEKEGIDDLIGHLRAEKTALTEGLEQKLVSSRQYAERLEPKPRQRTGQKLIEDVETAKAPIQQAMKDLESQIPDYPMEFTNLEDKFRSVLKDPKLSAGQQKAVEILQANVKKITSKGKSTHRALGVNRTINEAIDLASAQNEKAVPVLLKIKKSLEKDLAAVERLARSGKIAEFKGRVIDTDLLASEYERNLQTAAKMKAKSQPDFIEIVDQLNKKRIPAMQQKGESDKAFYSRIESDYKRLISEDVPTTTSETDKKILAKMLDRNKKIAAMLKKAEPGKDVAAAMKAYNDFASQEYFRRFDRGQLKRATGKQTMPENVATYFNSASGADDLINAVGFDKAQNNMRGYYAYDLIEKTTDPATGKIVTSKLKHWLARNQVPLKKYGLTNDFKKIGIAQDIADSAKAYVKDFEKSAAQRALDADPENAIARALSGNAPAKAASDLLKRVGNNKAALKGLRNALADYITKSTRLITTDPKGHHTMSLDKFTKLLNKWNRAAKVIYWTEPAKYKALQTMQKAYMTINRTSKSPLGGGSDTAENVLSAISSTNVLSWKVAMAKKIVGSIRKHGEKKVNQALNRALFDPEYADVLIKGMRGKITPLQVDKRLQELWEQAGIATALGAKK